MNDSAKTFAFIGGAVVLCLVAMMTTPGTAPPPEQFSDAGEAFYPEFTDPLAAAALEVIAYDETTGTARPFKVEVKDGLWSIPSHYDYPADGEDRLAKTASGIIDLKKDAVQSDRIEDHEALGVIDPLDETVTTITGRGQRVRLLDAGGGVLADFIVGKQAEGQNRSGFRYVRLPEKKRTYAVKIDVDISTKFSDWIETNLLQLTSNDVDHLKVLDYSVNETTGRVEVRDRLELNKDGNDWSLDGLAETEEVNQGTVRGIPSALSNIRITGVRPKPAGLSADLKAEEGLRIDPITSMTLRSKGFFVSPQGQLLSNEGEVDAGTTEGVRYTLRFGEVIYGDGLDVSAGLEQPEEGEEAEPDTTGEENRYLFVTAAFDETLLGDKPQPPDGYVPTSEMDAEDDAAQDQPGDSTPATEDDHDASEDPPGEDEASPADDAASAEDDGTGDEPAEEEDASAEEDAAARKKAREDARRLASAYERELEEWNTKVEEGTKAAKELNDRFAPWYYVIGGKDFTRIRVDRSKVVKEKTEE